MKPRNGELQGGGGTGLWSVALGRIAFTLAGLSPHVVHVAAAAAWNKMIRFIRLVSQMLDVSYMLEVDFESCMLSTRKTTMH